MTATEKPKRKRDPKAPISPGDAFDRLQALSFERAERIEKATQRIDEDLRHRRELIIQCVPPQQQNMLARMLEAVGVNATDAMAVKATADGEPSDFDDDLPNPEPQISPSLLREIPPVDGVEIDRERGTTRRTGAARQ